MAEVLPVGNGAGVWVMEDDNPHTAEEKSFNAAYYVTLGSEGSLPVLAEDSNSGRKVDAYTHIVNH
eukprot:4291090-Amphidinium_carterae.1